MDKSVQGKEQFARMRLFMEYLETTSKTFFNLFFSDCTQKQIPYNHRWAVSYKKSVLAKLYQLKIWASRHSLGFGMISLTCSQAGLTDEQILINLKEAWDKYRQTLSKMDYQFFIIYEPHDSGIAHIHALVIGSLNDGDIERLRSLWIEKYEMGNEHAFEFSASKKEIENLVNYLMKYMSKTICVDVASSDKLMRFHSLFWDTGKRLWSKTKYLGFVMMRFRKTDNPQVSSKPDVSLERIEISGNIEGELYNKNNYIEGEESLYFECLKICKKKDVHCYGSSTWEDHLWNIIHDLDWKYDISSGYSDDKLDDCALKNICMKGVCSQYRCPDRVALYGVCELIKPGVRVINKRFYVGYTQAYHQKDTQYDHNFLKNFWGLKSNGYSEV